MSKAGPDAPLRVGVLGLGMAGAVMVPVVAAHPKMELAAAADRNADFRNRIAADLGVPVHADAEGLMRRDDVDAVYIATPHQFHREHAELAARHGKHIIVEKPMALTLADCDAMRETAARHGVTLIVGHTHSFDPPIRYMREAAARGEFGPLAMLAMWNYTDFLYRPRRPEELDTAQGGGILFNQVPHQVDIARVLAASPVRSVRAMTGMLDPSRPTEGCCSAFLQFESGAAATLVYSGYDRFDSDELHDWVGATGRKKTPRHGAARRALRALPDQAAEARLREERYGYGGGFVSGEAEHQSHCGLIVASYAHADVRVSPDGVSVYDGEGRREVVLPGHTAGRAEVLDELWEAVREGRPPTHDGAFARGTLETCLAIRDSARTRREILL